MYEHIIIYISRIETIKSNNLHYSYKTTQIKHRRHIFGLLKKRQTLIGLQGVFSKEYIIKKNQDIQQTNQAPPNRPL